MRAAVLCALFGLVALAGAATLEFDFWEETSTCTAESGSGPDVSSVNALTAPMTDGNAYLSLSGEDYVFSCCTDGDVMAEVYDSGDCPSADSCTGTIQTNELAYIKVPESTCIMWDEDESFTTRCSADALTVDCTFNTAVAMFLTYMDSSCTQELPAENREYMQDYSYLKLEAGAPCVDGTKITCTEDEVSYYGYQDPTTFEESATCEESHLITYAGPGKPGDCMPVYYNGVPSRFYFKAYCFEAGSEAPPAVNPGEDFDYSDWEDAVSAALAIGMGLLVALIVIPLLCCLCIGGILIYCLCIKPKQQAAQKRDPTPASV